MRPAEHDEEWLPVVEFPEHYSVSCCGKVKRTGAIPGAVVGRILRPSFDRDGYVSHGLNIHGVAYRRRAHRMVAEAFIGAEPPGKPMVLHGDGDVVNNHYSNLRWGDAAENQDDAKRHGTHWSIGITECKRGHPLDSENTYVDNLGKRSCKICRKVAAHSHRSRARGTTLPDGDKRHGKANTYFLYGCRCEMCKAAGREHRMRYRKGGYRD